MAYTQRDDNQAPRAALFDVTDMNLKCAECGVEITQLPFRPDPDNTRPIYCRDCNRKRRENFRRRY